MLDKLRNVLTTLAKTASQMSQMISAIKAIWQEHQIDALTGLNNKRSFERALSEVIGEVIQSKRPIAIVAIDIDRLEDLNKRHGVLVGDHVLKQFAKMLKENCKGKDFAARYGSDEFAIILPDTILADAVALADKLRQKVSGLELINKTSKKTFGSITVSCGVAAFRENDGMRQLVERAELMLCEAKRRGRNQVCADSAEQQLAQGLGIATKQGNNEFADVP